VKAVPPPPVKDPAGWAKTDVDRFLLAGLEAKGLSPAGRADRRALIRRAALVLTGLPPDPADVEAFVADGSPDATRFATVVDRLLASPAFGERWARHWLDLVRYAETRGHEFDYDIPGAYQYRDYVIRAFNADVPYDRFVAEHVAGDLLPEPRRDPTGTIERVGPRHRLLVPERAGPLAGRHPAGRVRPGRQPDRRVRQDVPRADGRVRPLPRPQVRRDLGQGLLRAGRVPALQQLPRGAVRARAAQPEGGRPAGRVRAGRGPAGVGRAGRRDPADPREAGRLPAGGGSGPPRRAADGRRRRTRRGRAGGVGGRTAAGRAGAGARARGAGPHGPDGPPADRGTTPRPGRGVPRTPTRPSRC
jgi:hypothetical protein